MKENRLRWYGHKFKDNQKDFIVKRVESIIMKVVRSRERLKKTLRIVIKYNLSNLNINNDIVLHRAQ